MPLTPFVGLSVFIHLVVIALHWVFPWTHKKQIRKKSVSIYTRIGTFFIVVIIFLFVIVQAGFLVYVSITDKHSNIKVLANHMEEIKNYVFYKLPIAIAEKNTQMQTPENTVTILCQTESSTYYLLLNESASSFSERKELASLLGIENYSGRYGENQVLFQELSKKFKKPSSAGNLHCEKV